MEDRPATTADIRQVTDIIITHIVRLYDRTEPRSRPEDLHAELEEMLARVCDIRRRLREQQRLLRVIEGSAARRTKRRGQLHLVGAS